MLFSQILGQESIKNHLTQSATLGRIPHAQLFVGPEGCGTLPMAIAYARYILCQNVGVENEGGSAACNLKFDHFSHPDLHFIYPTATNDLIKGNAKSLDYIAEWREFVSEKPYGNLIDWNAHLGIENKNSEIRVNEAQELLKTMALKPYEGGYKVVIIWMAEKINTITANKLLKILEEPEEKTVLLLISEDEESIIQTIRSRCQVLHFAGLPEKVIADVLVLEEEIELKEAFSIARKAQGSYNKALQLLYTDAEDLQFEEWFVFWVRAAFKAKGNASVIIDLIQWSEQIASLGRERQKKFLLYCIEMFRQALLINYQAPSLVYLDSTTGNFSLEKFAPFVNGSNIDALFTSVSEAINQIERNINSKIILTDLSIQLTRIIHKK